MLYLCHIKCQIASQACCDSTISDKSMPAWKIILSEPVGTGILKHSTLKIIDSSDSSSRIVRTVTTEDEIGLSEELKQETAKDSDFGLVLPWLSEGVIPSEETVFSASPGATFYLIHKQELRLKNGVLRRQIPDQGQVMVVPEGFKERLLRGYYDIPSTGHQGIDRTQSTIREKYFWHGMSKDVKSYVTSCPTCNKNKKPNSCLYATHKLSGWSPYGEGAFGFPWTTTKNCQRK